MNIDIENYFNNNAYKKRKKTDAFFLMPSGSAHYKGSLDESIKYVEEYQLLDENLWETITDQFGKATDDCDFGWRGEYWGKLMRGAVFTYKYTQNKELYRIIVKYIKKILEKQENCGRISTYSIENEFHGWDIWCRKYVLLGMQYFLDICDDTQLKSLIVDSMCEQLNYIICKIGEGTTKKSILYTSDHWQGLNSSSILEPVLKLYSLTGKQEYFEFGKYIISCGGIIQGNIFKFAKDDKISPYQYPVTKAYEMISNFEGLAEYYRLTGDNDILNILNNFAKQILSTDFTIIGCSGCTNELFDHSTIQQFNASITGIMQETCVMVTLIKFLTHMLCITGNVMYADAIEISIYNDLLGAINTQRVIKPGNDFLMFDSYSPLTVGIRGRKVGGEKHFLNGQMFGCCAAIGAAGTGLIPIEALMYTKKGIAINLYISGTINCLTPESQKFVLLIETLYPYKEDIMIKIKIDTPEYFEIKLRIPSFCNNANINGEKVKSGYHSIKKLWHDNDELLLHIDMPIKMLKSEDIDCNTKEKYFALLRGPIALARDEKYNDGDIAQPISIQINDDGNVASERVHTSLFKTNEEYKIKLNNQKKITVADYASCGKMWQEKIALWIKRDI